MIWNEYPEKFEPLLESIEEFEPNEKGEANGFSIEYFNDLQISFLQKTAQ